MSKKKTVEQKIQFFKDEVYRYIDIFGLYSWEIYIEEDDNGEDSKAALYHHELNSNRIAVIKYSLDWISEKTADDKEISTAALHEVLELLLLRVRDYSNNKILLISEREVDEEIHRIIRTFENVILKYLKEDK